MTTIFMNVNGSYGGGGPTVFAARFRDYLILQGYKVIFDKPHKADIAFCIIESGKVLKQIDRKKTKVVVRLDGAYFKEYWHSKTPDRMWRPDMTSLHAAIKRDVENVDVMIYQSNFSKTLIDAEIAERKDKFEMIGNGVDTNIFKPANKNNGEITIGHVGVIRNDYIIDSLLSIKKHKLIICGPMDAVCSKIFNKNKNNNVKYVGSISNTQLPKIYSDFDIFLAPRQGSSCDNVIVEAQACGIPCVLPEWGGNKDSIIDGQTGIVVKNGGHWNYGDEYNKKLADAIEQIISDLDGYKKRARDHAVKNLDIKIMMDKYLVAMGLKK